MGTGIRVLVIDDSAFVREVLREGLNKDPNIQVIATATGPYEARDMILKHLPDVLTLDVSMPRMNGLEFLQKLMPQYPLPTVMVSAFTEDGAEVTLKALESGAVDFVSKPKSGKESSLENMLIELRTKIKIASTVNVGRWKRSSEPKQVGQIVYPGVDNLKEKLIAIGASTGGTEAIKEVLVRLPRNSPGVVIVQHMPEKFTNSFAKRLNSLSALDVSEARNGDLVEPGKALLAPGDRHMEVQRRNGNYRVFLNDKENVSGHRPSVDVLMLSVAKAAGSNACGVILTGMGSDGARGLLEMKLTGARTIGQDRHSCVVFGMPKMAHELGAVQRLVPLGLIAAEIIRSF
jgi:two-component system, chemotaxis family, protein-glutamate methylesterase/glutaminase